MAPIGPQLLVRITYLMRKRNLKIANETIVFHIFRTGFIRLFSVVTLVNQGLSF